MRCFTMVLLTLCLVSMATARPNEFDTPEPPPKLDEVLLTDGTLLQGKIIEEREDVVVFETESLGRMEIPRDRIVGLARGTDRAGAITDPDYNSLMFCPTPATLARGDSYFRDFELFILNFGLSVTDAFDLSIGTLFPVSSDVMMVSVGGKLRLLDRSESPLGLALVGSYTSLEEIQFGGVGFVAGIGNKRNSLNLSVSRTFEGDGDTETVILAGADYQGTRRTKIFLEYMSTASLLEDENDDDFHGFLNLGLRIFGARHSFSLSGFRPLDNDSDSLLGFPMIMYSYHW